MAKTKNTPKKIEEKDLHPAVAAGREKKMSEFTDMELKAMEEKIREALFKMLIKNEFFGIVALRLRREFTDVIPTAATDGRSIFYNPAFVEKLSTDEIVFLVAHEVMHCVYEHFIRRGSRKPQWWNMAGDYIINNMLKRERIGKVIEPGALLNPDYEGLATEDIYQDLEDQAAEFLETLDTHFEVSDGEDDNDGEGKDGENKPGKMRPLTPEEAKQIKDELRATLIQAEKTAGNVPGEIKRIIKSFLEPKISWQQLIEAAIASKERYDTSFAHPDRKSWSNSSRIIFPGAMPGEKINIAIAIDVSGSITDEMAREFLSEIKGMMNSYSSFVINLWTFDTEIHGHTIFTEDNADELDTYECLGGGGTYIKKNFDFYEDNEIEADMMVVFTDLYCGSLNMINQNLVDTVWILSHNPEGVPPFGKYAHYEHAK